jgi:hypothetical protein
MRYVIIGAELSEAAALRQGGHRMYRQGDILIVPIDSLPEGLEPVPAAGARIILAHGEATGHAHAISDRNATLFRDPRQTATFLLVPGEDQVALEHQEHETIALAPGLYRIVRQREYAAHSTRFAAD